MVINVLGVLNLGKVKSINSLMADSVPNSVEIENDSSK
jgi:hypothetical protein